MRCAEFRMGVMSDIIKMRGNFVIANEGTKDDAMAMADAFGRSFRAQLDRDYDAILDRGSVDVGVFSAAASMQCAVEVNHSAAIGKERAIEVAEQFAANMREHVDEYYDVMLLWKKSAGVEAYEAAGLHTSSIFDADTPVATWCAAGA